ncbi:hypothetical protein D3C80_2026380 [compost metagenome]
MPGKAVRRISSGTVTGNYITLVLDGPADQQGAPVGKPRLGPFGADEQDFSAAGCMGADPFRETDIVADQPGA